MTDANIWIDFEHTEALAAVFKAPFCFVTPDLILAELGDTLAARTRRLGLRVEELTGEEVGRVIALAARYPKPGRRDLAALVLAQRMGAALLTGDGALRECAAAEGVEVHGTLFLLDQMVAGGALTGERAADAVELMLKAGSRLPLAEAASLKRRWLRK